MGRVRILAACCALALCGCTSSAKTMKWVTKDDYGEMWPLTIDRGTLACISGAVILRAKGTTFAINGTAQAMGKSRGWVPIDLVWAPNPNVKGLKMDLGPLLRDGLSMCK